MVAGCDLASTDDNVIFERTASISLTVGFDEVEVHLRDAASARWWPRDAAVARDLSGARQRLVGLDDGEVLMVTADRAGTELGLEAVADIDGVALASMTWGVDEAAVVGWMRDSDLDGEPRAESLAVLVAQASSALANAALHRDLTQLKNQFHHDARHDPLTGLLNRAGLMVELARCIAAARGPRRWRCATWTGSRR